MKKILTILLFDRDPDTVDYIKAAKENKDVFFS